MRHLFLTASLGALLAASSFAARAGDAEPDHMFVNAGAGITHSNVAGFTDKTSWGYDFNFGYRWRDTWGIEGGYVDLGEPQVKAFYGGNPFKLNFHVTGWTLGANGRWTFADNWHASARLGAFFSKSKLSAGGYLTGADSATDTNLYVGAGIGYDFSSRLSFGLNIDRYRAQAKGILNGTNSPYLASATLEYRFNIH
jgi:OmpA-OmpF porin, OOP family